MKNSIRRRTFIYIALGMLVIVAAFSFLFYGFYYNVFRTRIEQDQQRTTVSMAESIGTVLTNIRQNAYYLCSNDTLASYMSNKNGQSTVHQWEQLSQTFSLSTGAPNTPLMQSAYAMLLVDPQFPLAQSIRGNFSIRRMTQQRVYSAQDVLKEEWYQRTVALRGQVYAFHSPEDQQNVFFAQFLRSSRMADPRYSENLGVVLYAVPESRLMNILKGGLMTDDAIGLLLFDGKPFIATDDALLDEKLAEQVETLLNLPADGASTPLTLDGVSYLASSVAFQGEWQCVLLLPDADVFRHIQMPMSMMAVVVVLFLAISGVLSFLLSKQLTRPIIRLSDAMAEAKEGHYLPPAVPAPHSNDEIAVLYNHYNSMTEHIQQLLKQTAEEAAKVRSAELKALQAQINPHFVYNTLDSVSCSALMEGNDDIVTMVTSLISILKYSVNFSRTIVPLQEEIDYLQHYIRIQELRYKNGFRFTCDVPEKYYGVAVSQIILQPLVENALFHAYCPDKPLEIHLFCEEEGPWLRIHVTDNGADGHAETLNAMLCSDESKDADSYGIGIRNVDHRIRLLLGEGSGLHYEQLSGGGMDAIIRVPLQNEKSE